MLSILTTRQMRAVDRHMIEHQRIPGIVLMEHAALGVTEAVIKRGVKRVRIICGGGNNGGDGLSVLRQLCMRGIEADAVLLFEPQALSEDARLQYDMAVSSGLSVSIALDERAVAAVAPDEAQLLVDALFGTGLSRAVEGRYRLMIARMNASKIPIIAVDIPSGVDGDTGAILGDAVQAEETVTFQYKKRGHMLLPGRERAGKVTVTPIGLPNIKITDALEEWTGEDVDALLYERPLDSHKGKNGRALLLAGSERYMGAALMSATAALRSGCGLLHVAVPGGLVEAMRSLPAAITHAVGSGTQWDIRAAEQAAELIDGADAIALGPGMGGGEGVKALLKAALSSGKPLVIDADGLNALAVDRALLNTLNEHVVLTPHPGEMARLTGRDAADIASDPISCADKFAHAHGCTLLLKGATSVIAQKGRIALNTRGNTGLSKGGSGDVLTGIVLALLAQKHPAYAAACAGAYILGSKAEEAYALLKTRVLMPTDIIEALCGGSCLNKS